MGFVIKSIKIIFCVLYWFEIIMFILSFFLGIKTIVNDCTA